jgi:chromosomal replication initiator protein
MQSPGLRRTEAAANGLRNRLNTALTFDTLVEGTANRMARAAAMHVAGMPGICTTRCSSTAGSAWARPT